MRYEDVFVKGNKSKFVQNKTGYGKEERTKSKCKKESHIRLWKWNH